MVHSDDDMRALLKSVRTVAMVGASLNPLRPSYFVARYLALRGIRVIPVNPGHVGEDLFGQTVVGSLEDLRGEKIDMLDVFRRSDQVLPIVEAALSALPDLRILWLQLGVENAEATALARAHGMHVVENRCPKIEYQRLFGELRMGGFNTGVVSSRL